MFYLMEILKLDSALEILYLNQDKPSMNVRGIQQKMPFKLRGEEISMILDKFRIDDLVSRQTGTKSTGYCITYKGMKFYQRGGYLREKVRIFFKKAMKIAVMILGFISTVVGVILGLRQLL